MKKCSGLILGGKMASIQKVEENRPFLKFYLLGFSGPYGDCRKGLGTCKIFGYVQLSSTATALCCCTTTQCKQRLYNSAAAEAKNTSQ